MSDIIQLVAASGPSNCDDGTCATNLPSVIADGDQVAKLFSLIFGIAAAIAILVIVIAAINFITGGGDPEKISRAKRAIIFSLVGLAIAISAEAIVLTVLGRF